MIALFFSKKKQQQKTEKNDFLRFLGISDFSTLFDIFLFYFLFYFISIFGFLNILFGVFRFFFWFFVIFVIFLIFFLILGFFFGFFCFYGIPFKVTKVTTKSYQGYYWAPKIVKNGSKQHNKLFFCPKGKKSLGQRPKPSAGARSRPA